MTTITTTPVATGEVITSAWGNGVRTDLLALNAGKLEISGGSLTGMVSLGINPTSASHLTRKAWVDSVIATEASARATGDALRVLKAGDTMTGPLQVGGNGTSAEGVRLANTGTIRSYGDDSLDNVGSMAFTRVGTLGAAPGEAYIYFLRGAGADVVGSIVINGAGTGVLYNATSDRRSKEDLGLLDPDELLARVLRYQPRRLRAKNDDAEFDGLIADEVQAVNSQAVTGQPDAMWPDDHPDEAFAGKPRFQQLDQSQLVYDLIGAVQALAARVDGVDMPKPVVKPKPKEGKR